MNKTITKQLMTDPRQLIDDSVVIELYNSRKTSVTVRMEEEMSLHTFKPISSLMRGHIRNVLMDNLL